MFKKSSFFKDLKSKKNNETLKPASIFKERMIKGGEAQPKKQTRIETAAGELVLDSYGLPDKYYDTFKTQNIANTIFPLNTPVYFCGQKGSGKTYLLATLAQRATREDIVKRVFYLYAHNIDNTIARAVNRRVMFSIPIDIASSFLFKFLKKKTRYITCFNYLESLRYCKTHGINIQDTEQPEYAETYWDNFLDELVKRKKFKNVAQLKQYAEKTVHKYETGTQIKISADYTYNVGKLNPYDFDMVIIDDIAQFYELFGSNRNSSPLYKYFTITRQNKINFYMTGQEIIQLPKMFREMLGGVCLLNGTDIHDLKELKLPRYIIKQIQDKWRGLRQYQGFFYNYNDNMLERI